MYLYHSDVHRIFKFLSHLQNVNSEKCWSKYNVIVQNCSKMLIEARKRKKSKKFLTKVWILTLVSFSFPNTVEDKIDEPSIHFWCFILMHMYVPTMALDSLFTFYDISFQFPTYLSYLDSLWHVTISDFRYSFYSDYIKYRVYMHTHFIWYQKMI